MVARIESPAWGVRVRPGVLRSRFVTFSDKGEQFMSVQHTMSLEQFEELHEDNGGMCINCGAEAYDVEPDAHNLKCEDCGSYAVYGAEELLVMDLVD
jgi:hypothetical protein